nr:unnamed protein product [Spirometra erinaceieuropaei]
MPQSLPSLRRTHPWRTVGTQSSRRRWPSSVAHPVTHNLLSENERLQKTYIDHPTDDDNKAAFYRCRRLVQQRLREMQNARTARKAKEIQGNADHNEWKDYFSAICCPPAEEKTQILQQWAKQFRGVLKNPSTISDTAIVRPPQLKTNTNLDLPPSLHETISTVQQLSSEKAPASDASSAEVYKHDGPEFMEHPTALFHDMRRQGEVSQDFNDTTIIHLYKRIKNRQLCDNYRGICLLNIAGKIFAQILLNRLHNHLDQCLLAKSQGGFGRYRGTMGRIVTTHQLQQRRQEMRTQLHFTFVDLTNALDRVNCDETWIIMR